MGLLIQVLDNGKVCWGIDGFSCYDVRWSVSRSLPLRWEVRCLKELVEPALLISLGVSKPDGASLPWSPMESVGDTCRNVSARAHSRVGIGQRGVVTGQKGFVHLVLAEPSTKLRITMEKYWLFY